MNQSESDRFLTSLGYKVLATIGEGTYAKIKVAMSDKYPRPVAIKIMERQGQSPDFLYEKLPRELSILRTVRHPHINLVHDIIDTRDKQVYIVMEVAQTDLLKTIYRLGRIPIGQAREWFSQILSAMVYLHQQDVAHRDLKPANVLLTKDNQVKLIDFGFGCFTKGFRFRSRTICGTPYYVAPEVLSGDPYDPKKSDVWSLGVLLYVMIIGYMPFQRCKLENLPEVQSKPIRFPFWIRVEKPCRDLITWMLQIDPEQRPSMEQVAQHPWLQASPESCGTPEQQAETRGLLGFFQKLKMKMKMKRKGREKAAPCRETQPSSGLFPTAGPTETRVPGSDAEVATGPDASELQLHQEESRPSSSLSREVESRRSSTYEDSVEFFSAQQSLELESYCSSSSRQLDGLSSSTFHSTQESMEVESPPSSASEEVGVLSSQAARCESLRPEPEDGRSAEDVGKELGCFGALCASVKRTAHVRIVAPIVGACRSLRRSLRRTFRSQVCDSSSSQQRARRAAEAPAPPASVQVCGPAEGPKAGVKQKPRRLKIPKFKILKTSKVSPCSGDLAPR